MLILMARRYKSGSGFFVRGKTGLPGSGTRFGERGEEVRGVRMVVRGEAIEGRMTFEGGVGVRGRPRVGGCGGGMGGRGGRGQGEGGGDDLLVLCMRIVSWSQEDCLLRRRCSLYKERAG